MEPDAPSSNAQLEPASPDRAASAYFTGGTLTDALRSALLKGTASAVPQAASATLRLQPLRYALLAGPDRLSTGLAGSMLRAFPPETSTFYPACPFYQWTGLLCPGCGGTRALAALAHGHLAEAVRWNGLIVALLAMGVAWMIWAGLRSLLQPAKPQAVWPSTPRTRPGRRAGAAALIFAVVRNLP